MSHSNSVRDFRDRLREWINSSKASVAGPESDRFQELALELFELQFRAVTPYRTYCQSLGVHPGSISHWSQIPALPAAAFKDFEVTSLAPPERTTVFFSSGTTAQRKSRHFHSVESIELYEQSLCAWFQPHVLAETAAEKPKFLVLAPPPNEAPHSSLVHMFETVAKTFGSTRTYLGTATREGLWGIDENAALDQFKRAQSRNCPHIVLGTAFAFVHLLELFERNSQSYALPRRSVAMETGGYKGQSRQMPKVELHRWIQSRLSLDAGHVVCEYGMSELSSQAYDLRSGATAPFMDERIFRFPPWARARVISPESGLETREKEPGLLQVFDLANVYSVLALQTEDLAVAHSSGFQLLGRLTGAEPRGCSLNVNWTAEANAGRPREG